MVGRFSSNSVVWVVFVLLMLVEALEDQDGEENGAEERVEGRKLTMPDVQDRKQFDGLDTSNRQSGTTSEENFMNFEEVFKLMEERSEMLKENLLDHNSCDPILYPKANIITTLLEIVNGFSMPGAGTTEYCSRDLFNGPITIQSKVDKRLVLKPQYVDQPLPSRASRKYSLLTMKKMVKEGTLKETIQNSDEDEDTIFIYTIDEKVEDPKTEITQPLGLKNSSMHLREDNTTTNASMYWRNDNATANASMYWRTDNTTANASMYWRNTNKTANASMYWRNVSNTANSSNGPNQMTLVPGTLEKDIAGDLAIEKSLEDFDNSEIFPEETVTRYHNLKMSLYDAQVYDDDENVDDDYEED